MTSQKTLDAIETFAKQAIEMPERVVPRYRRTLDQHITLMKNIPHASPTVRSRGRNTMFPSIDAMFRDKKRIQEEEEINKLLSNAKPGDLESVASLLATDSLQAEIKRYQQIEEIDLLNQKYGGALPINREDIQLEAEAIRTSKLRSAFDKVKQMARQKTEKLRELVLSTEEKSSSDEQVAALFESADMAMGSLDERYESLNGALEDARGLNTHLSKLIAFLNVRPPFSERHVSSLEQELVLAKQQFSDLMKFRNSLYAETEKLEKVTGKRIKDRIKAIQQQRKILREKLKSRKLAIMKAHGRVDELDERLRTAKDNGSVNDDSVNTVGMPVAPQKDWSIMGECTVMYCNVL